MASAIEDPYAAADEHLGICGRQMSGTKQEKPGQRVVWNANVCVKSREEGCQFAELVGGPVQVEVAEPDFAGENLYVLRERDARFENEAKPLYDKAVEVFEP